MVSTFRLYLLRATYLLIVVGLAVQIEFARSLDGLTHVHPAVAESGQAAQALHEHLGFRTWGTEPAAIRVGEVSVAEHHMVRALGPGAA